MSKIQWTTLIFAGAYLLWEFVFLADWKVETSGPLIRVDLLVIYPVLIVLAVMSIWQCLRR